MQKVLESSLDKNNPKKKLRIDEIRFQKDHSGLILYFNFTKDDTSRES